MECQPLLFWMHDTNWFTMPCCQIEGGWGRSCGAVDPKIFRKWVQPFIEALAELQYKVTSDLWLMHFIFVLVILAFLFYLETVLRITMAVTASYWWGRFQNPWSQSGILFLQVQGKWFKVWGWSFYSKGEYLLDIWSFHIWKVYWFDGVWKMSWVEGRSYSDGIYRAEPHLKVKAPGTTF